MHFLKSLFQTIYSPTFYKETIKRGVRKAFGNYTLCIILITIISSIVFGISFGKTLLNLPEEIKTWPEFTVKDNELTVTGLEMPFETTNEGQYFAVDTTDTITTFPTGYHQGAIFNKNKMILRSEDYQGDMETYYNDALREMELEEIIVTHEMLTSTLGSLGVVFLFIYPILAFIGTWSSKLISILIITGIGYIVLSSLKQKEAFNKSLILSLYAFIPAYYVGKIWEWTNAIMDKAFDISFNDFLSLCCLIGLVLWIARYGIFWFIGYKGIK